MTMEGGGHRGSPPLQLPSACNLFIALLICCSLFLRRVESNVDYAEACRWGYDKSSLPSPHRRRTPPPLQQQRNHHRGKGMKEPDLKKRKKNEEQEPTPPVVDATGATVGADKHDASDQPDVLSEPVAAGGGGAEACTLGKHVADASSSDNDRKDGSKKTNKRKTDQVTADGEEARLFLVDNTTCCTVVGFNDGVINDNGASIDHKKEAGSRVVQDMGSPRDSAMMSLAQGGRRSYLCWILIACLPISTKTSTMLTCHMESSKAS